MWVKVKLTSSDWLLVDNIYHSPSSDNNTSTSNVCDLVGLVWSTKPSFLLVTGDFNYPVIDWIQTFPLASNYFEQMFVDTIEQQVLHQMILHPIRYCTDSQSHILYWQMVKDINYLPGLGMSDHICASFNLEWFVLPAIKRMPSTISTKQITLEWNNFWVKLTGMSFLRGWTFNSLSKDSKMN